MPGWCGAPSIRHYPPRSRRSHSLIPCRGALACPLLNNTCPSLGHRQASWLTPWASVCTRKGIATLDLERYKDAGGRDTPEQMARKHVYVVNGSPDFLDVVRELLQDEHYNVTTTNFVPSSFATIEASQPSLLIVDLVVGQQAGWNLLTQLRQAASTWDIPVLLISTTPDLLDTAREKHEVFGGDRYLVKPFDLEDLLALTDELIGAA